MEALTDPMREQAAQLLAEGRYEQAEIAQKSGVERMTLWRWRQEPEFAARVEYLQEEFNKAALKRGIARKEYRINVLADKENRLRSVLEARASDPDMSKIPGGETGLLVRKPVASMGVIVGYEYAVDTGTLRELRALHEQVSKELGQLVDRREVKADVTHSLAKATDEELDSELTSILTGSTAADGSGDESEDFGDSAGAGSAETPAGDSGETAE